MCSEKIAEKEQILRLARNLTQPAVSILEIPDQFRIVPMRARRVELCKFPVCAFDLFVFIFVISAARLRRIDTLPARTYGIDGRIVCIYER